jgi:uncharacterized membrane protein
MKTLIIYGMTTVVFFAIDMLWLGLIAKNFYREKLGFILSPDVNWYAAVIFYLIYIGGILYFAVLPAMKDESWQTALIQGAVLGFLCYATYDLTNMATIKNWPLTVVLVDIIWGIVLTGSCALISYLVAMKFLT